MKFRDLVDPVGLRSYAAETEHAVMLLNWGKCVCFDALALNTVLLLVQAHLVTYPRSAIAHPKRIWPIRGILRTGQNYLYAS